MNLITNLFRAAALAIIPAVVLIAPYGVRAENAVAINIPSGDLAAALEAFAKQSGIELVFRADQVQGLRTAGISGTLTPADAVQKLLEGTPFRVETDPQTGAMVISKKTSADHSAMNLSLATPNAATSVQNQNADESNSRAGGSARAGEVEEIVVTAQKRSERLQEVPVPVTALNAESISANNQLRIQDYYTQVPGLSLALIADSAPSVAIRGLTMGGATNPTVGIVIDEAPYGSSVTIGSDLSVADIDPSDLAQVEVLRGPQGTLYGASSLGGLLKFATVDPSTEAFGGRMRVGMLSVSNSDDFGYDIYGALNVPVSDTFALRGSAFTKRAPGYIDNVQTGEDDVNQTENTGGRLAALWRLSDDASLKLSAFSQSIDRAGSAEVHLLPGVGELEQSALRGSGIYERETQAYAATLNAALGAVALTSATGYSIDDTLGAQDVSSTFFSSVADSFFGVDGATDFFTRRVEKLSQELRVSVPLSSTMDWLIGGFYTRERVDVAADFTAVDPASGNKVGRIVKVHTPDNRFDEYAVFTNVTYRFTDRFDVQVGGRYSENRQSYASVTFGALANRSISRFYTRDNSFTYLVTPRFKLSPDIMVYGRFASGYRPGAPNVNCGLVPCGYTADTTQNYEIGMKGSALDELLSFDASVYYIDWKDIQLESTTPQGFGFITNGESATSQGVELSLTVRPLTGLEITGWVAWNDAKLTESFPVDSTNIGLRGDQLPYGSPFSGNLSIEQEFTIGANTGAFIGGSFSYVDERRGVFPSIYSVPPARQIYPSYTQLDLHAGVRLQSSWTVNAFVNNVTDKRALLGGDSNNFVPFAYSFSQPRTMGISVGKTF